MASTKIGSFIEEFSQRCGIPNLSLNDVSGINIEKEFFSPSKQKGKDTSGYKIVPPGYFACNLMHVGRDKLLPVARNKTSKNIIVSPAYTVFFITKPSDVCDVWFELYLQQKGFNRYCWFKTDSLALPFLGLNIKKEFMKTVADTSDVSIDKYKILRKGYFVFSGMQTGRDQTVRIGLYKKDSPALVSPAYTTFALIDTINYDPNFVFLALSRKENDRFGWFLSDSSIRSNLDWDRFVTFKVPCPKLDEQKRISTLFNCAKEFDALSEGYKKTAKIMASVLIRGSQEVGK